MRLNIFVMLVLALFFAAGMAAKIHSRPAHYEIYDPKDPAFLKLDLKIRAQEKGPLGTAFRVFCDSDSFPRSWFVKYHRG